MFKFVEKHPFIFGIATGVVGVRIFKKKLKKMLTGRIIILNVVLGDDDILKKEQKEDFNNTKETKLEN